MIKLNAFILLIFYCISCLAQTIQFPLSDKGWGQYEDGFLPEKWHLFDRVKLYETRLDDIDRFYGESNRFKEGKKNYSPDLKCYIIEDDYIVLFQSGPLGGWSIITEILIAEKSVYDNSNCIKRIKLSARIADLKIGDTKERVYEILGQTAIKEVDLLVYRYEQEGGSKLSDKEKVIYVTSGIEIGLRNGKISWMRVYWQEST